MIQWRSFTASVLKINAGGRLLAISEDKQFQTEFPVEEYEHVEKFFDENLVKYADMDELYESDPMVKTLERKVEEIEAQKHKFRRPLIIGAYDWY